MLDDRASHFLVQPGYPRVNLWPASARALFGPGEELPRITPTWGKKYLSLDRSGFAFQSGPLPLSAIYVLDIRKDALDVPVLEELSVAESFPNLVANTYLNYLLDADMRKREFEVLGRLAGAVPVRRASPARDSSGFLHFAKR